jgi:hypothetical protein
MTNEVWVAETCFPVNFSVMAFLLDVQAVLRPVDQREQAGLRVGGRAPSDAAA